MTALAPILLFTYKRLDTLKETVSALQNNHLAKESDLFVFSDAAKGTDDKIKVEEVRNYVKSLKGFKSVTVHEAEINKGLASSIIQGITHVLGLYDKAIVLEDDIVTSAGFLKYMNGALDHYKDNDSVMQVSAYMFPIDPKELPDTFFYQANTCWGWGTWKRSWNHFNEDGNYILKELKDRGISWKDFNAMQGNEFKKQLLSNINGKLKTWAVKWHAAIILNGGLVLHPKESYVKNIGFDGDGENCKTGNFEGQTDDKLNLDFKAAEFESSSVALKRLKKHFKFRYSLIGKVIKRIKPFVDGK